MLKIVSPKLLNELSQKALSTPRKRVNHNFHDDLTDPINRMLNALEPGTYLQPQRWAIPATF
ncbi:MAG: WbuC family cupin fold metalloprotein [Bacteroidota bacterium]|nr:WbuC family cupin fold metalloprotein [Bacteroidota bacterium]